MRSHLPAYTPEAPRLRLRAASGGSRIVRGRRVSAHVKFDRRSVLRDCVQCLPDPLLVLDIQTHILLSNPAALALFSKPGWNTLEGLSAYDLLSGWQCGDAPQLAPPQTLFKSGLGTWCCETRSPSQQHFQISCTPLPDHGHAQPTTFMLRLTDLTATYAAMLHKEEHARFIAHDLRAPFSNIIALTESAKLQRSCPDAFVSAVERQAERGLSLTHNLLELSRVASTTLELSRIDLTANLLASISDAQPLANHQNVQISWGPDIASPCWVRAEAASLKRVFDNLLDNAVKFSPPHSVVHCTLSCLGAHCFVDIVDQGIGMDKSQILQLFKPYSRQHRQLTDIKGTGLGLFFVERAMQSWGGQVHVESTPGRGSRFRLIFAAVGGYVGSEADVGTV